MQRIFRRVAAIFLILAMLSGGAIFASAGNDDGSELIPVRSFFEDAGADVEWDGENRAIMITLEQDVIILFIDNNVALRNGVAMVLENAVIISQNLSYIALVDLQTLLTPEYLGGTLGVAALAAQQFMELMSIPGITMAIVDAKEGFTWAGGFGYADVEGNVPVSELTLFSLASISKTFTVTAAMQLAEEGVIDLDEPIVTYLPDLSMPTDAIIGEGDYRNITARMLMAHASGIYTDFLGFGVTTSGEPNPGYMNDYLDNLSRFPMNAPETTVFTYANNGTTLLGILVAEMTSEDSYYDAYADYMQENIFEPLGMDLTTFVLEDRHMPHLAQPYKDAETPDEFIYYNTLPAGGIFSNARDMARFMHTLLNGGALDGEESRILTSNSVNQMFELQDFGFDATASVIRPGLGILHSEGVDGFKYSGHAGNLIHYHSNMIFDRDSGLGVFVSVNSITGMAITEALSVLVLKSAIMEKTGTLNIPASNPDVEPAELTPEELALFEGIYVIIGADRLANVVVREDALFLENLPGVEEALLLIPLSDGSFVNPDSGVRFWFEEGEEGMGLVLGEFKSQFAGRRIEQEMLEVIASEEDIRHLIGVYVPVLEEGHVSILSGAVIGVDDNGLGYVFFAALHGSNAMSILIPSGENSFLGGLDFTIDGDEIYLEFSGLRMIKTG